MLSNFNKLQQQAKSSLIFWKCSGTRTRLKMSEKTVKVQKTPKTVKDFQKTSAQQHLKNKSLAP